MLLISKRYSALHSRRMPTTKRDRCLKCAEPTEHGYVFCEKCTPCYGQTTRIFSNELQKELTLYVGTIPTGSVMKDRLQGRLPVKWWLGTDALTMWFKPPGKRLTLVILHRIKMLLLEPFIYRHWFTGPRLIASLQRWRFFNEKKALIVLHPSKLHKSLKKSAHKGFNVFYYHPKNSGEFERWVYGIDIIEQLQERVDGVRWIRVDGSQDMREIYPIVDMYIRPSRHDGQPRINIECEINKIPVFYSADGNPDVLLFEKEIRRVQRQKSVD